MAENWGLTSGIDVEKIGQRCHIRDLTCPMPTPKKNLETPVSKLPLILVALGAAQVAHAEVFLHYAFEDDFTDSSAAANDGTLVVDGGGTSFVDAQFGRGWSHPVEADEDFVAFTTPFNPGAATAWTVAFWHDMSGGASSPLFDSQSLNHNLLVRADASTNVQLILGGQAAVVWNTPGIVSQSTFNHFVLVANPDGITGVDADGSGFLDHVALYVDGQLIVPNVGAPVDTYGTTVFSDGYGDGSSGDDTFTNGHGLSDELWIFEGDALDADQIESLRSVNDPCLGDSDADGVWDCFDLEACDGLDNDGDGLVDEADSDVADASVVYWDGDGDGLGDASTEVLVCTVETGFVFNADDQCPVVNPGACDADVDGCLDDEDGNNVCDTDQVFQLDTNEMVRGGAGILVATWAEPGARVYFIGSTRPEGTRETCVAADLGGTVCTRLRSFTVFGSRLADEDGTARLSLRVPTTLPAGTTVYLQAITQSGAGGVTEVASATLVDP